VDGGYFIGCDFLLITSLSFLEGQAMRLLSRALLLSILCIPNGVLAQQATMSQAEAQNNLDAMFVGANGCWVTFRLGEYNFIITDAAQGGSMYQQAQNLLALKEIGVVNWIDLQSAIGWAHFKIELRSEVDTTQAAPLRLPPNFACLKISATPENAKLVKVESVKGGATNWDGAIVYATVETTTTTPLYEKYIAARHVPSMASRKARYLFKYDIFKKDWSFRATDVAPLNAPDFNTQNIPNSLHQD
jgi:hypothetical protein